MTMVTEGSCDEYDGIERAIVSQGYEGLSRNYHPDNIQFTFFSVDRFCHYHCDIDEQQGANPSNDTIGERKQAWARHWYTTRILPEPELMILANAWAQERML